MSGNEGLGDSDGLSELLGEVEAETLSEGLSEPEALGD